LKNETIRLPIKRLWAIFNNSAKAKENFPEYKPYISQRIF